MAVIHWEKGQVQTPEKEQTGPQVFIKYNNEAYEVSKQ